jgi:hypothetical protein
MADGLQLAGDCQPLSNGPHNITATATDIASNVVSARRSAIIIHHPAGGSSQPDMVDASDSGSSKYRQPHQRADAHLHRHRRQGNLVTLFDNGTPSSARRRPTSPPEPGRSLHLQLGNGRTRSPPARPTPPESVQPVGGLPITIDIIVLRRRASDLTDASDDVPTTPTTSPRSRP